MDRTSADKKQLENILMESLLEISQGKTDSFHRVVSEVIDEVTKPNGRLKSVNEAPDPESGNISTGFKTD